MAHALLQHSAPLSQMGARCSQAARARVRSRVAFTRAESALGEVPAVAQSSKARVAVAEPLEAQQPPAVATMSLDTEQLQQLLLEEYKRGYEAGAAASREATPTPEKVGPKEGRAQPAGELLPVPAPRAAEEHAGPCAGTWLRRGHAAAAPRKPTTSSAPRAAPRGLQERATRRLS